MDLAATSIFCWIEDRFESTGEKSEKLVAITNGQIENTTHKSKLPVTQLNDDAQEINIILALKSNLLISVCKLSDAGYITKFHANKEGVTVHWKKDIAECLQWHSNHGPTNDTRHSNEHLWITINQAIDTILICCCRVPNKSNMVKSNSSRRLCYMINVQNVNKYFPESEETQKGQIK